MGTLYLGLSTKYDYTVNDCCLHVEYLNITFVLLKQMICHSLSTIPSQSQCFDILQTGICKYLVSTVLSSRLSSLR